LISNKMVTATSMKHIITLAFLLLAILCKAYVNVDDRPNRHGRRCETLSAIKATIRIVGRRSSEKWIEQGCQMYETRLKPNNVDVSTEWCKSNDALIKNVKSDAHKSTTPVILLDPFGKEMSSEEFTSNFYQWVEQGGSRIVFVIGGAEGLPDELRSGRPLNGQNPILYSLSQLTFTHQFARLVLIEQIYRASEIRKGSGYHK